MLLRLMPILALVSLMGLAACQEEGGEGESTESETGQTDDGGTESSD